MNRLIYVLLLSLLTSPLCAQVVAEPPVRQIPRYVRSRPLNVGNEQTLSDAILQAAPDLPDSLLRTPFQAHQVNLSGLYLEGRLDEKITDPKNQAKGLEYLSPLLDVDTGDGHFSDIKISGHQGWAAVLKRDSSTSRAGNFARDLEARRSLAGIQFAQGDAVYDGDITAADIRDNGLEFLSPCTVLGNVHTFNCGGWGGVVRNQCDFPGRWYVDAWHTKGGLNINAVGCYFQIIDVFRYGGSAPDAAAVVVNRMAQIHYVQADMRAADKTDIVKDKNGNVVSFKWRQHPVLRFNEGGRGTEIEGVRIMHARERQTVVVVNSDAITLRFISVYSTDDPADPDDDSTGVKLTKHNAARNRITGSLGTLDVGVDFSGAPNAHHNYVDITVDGNCPEPVRFPRGRNGQIKFLDSNTIIVNGKQVWPKVED